MLTSQDKQVVRGILKKVKATHWVKRHYRMIKRAGLPEPKECHCLVGHVNAAVGGVPHDWPSSGYRLLRRYRIREAGVEEVKLQQRDRILQAIERKLGVSIGWIEHWNDAPERTREDVERVLEEVLKS